jgi:PAT family beta-lactamase induction signal transducer AmpG
MTAASSVGASQSDQKKSRKHYKLKDYLNRRVLVMVALGFSSGLPFLLVGNTFGYWLRDEGTTLAAIGFLSWVGLAYSLKFLWAPILDRAGAPALARLGLRRGWMALAQIVVGLSLLAMALSGTEHGLARLGVCALLVAFFSATQDIAIDAWRIESARDKDELGLLTSGYTVGYRVALLLSETVILPIAQHLGWSNAYILFACMMVVGLTATMLAPEPVQADAVADAKRKLKPLWKPSGLFDAVAGPFIQFFKANGAGAVVILLAISLYQLGYFISGPMYNPMYVDVGVTKDMVATMRGSLGLVGIFAGVAVGGWLPTRIGLTPALIVAGICLGCGTALYAVVPFAHDPVTFGLIMLGDQFGIAIAGITLVAYMSSLTSLGYTATQYALLSSAYALAGKFLKGFSGAVVESLTPHLGLMNAYSVFFVGCGLIGVPAMLLFWLLERRRTAVNPA